MKKEYQKPQLTVVELQHKENMLQASTYHIDAVNTNLGGDAIGIIGDGSDEDYIEEDGVIR